MTKGEDLVDIGFNATGNDNVNRVKALAAKLIDVIEECGQDDRCNAIAIQHIENASMWGVKSIFRRLKT